MKKITSALGIIILSFILFIKTLIPVNENVATQSATDINCIKGDKIVDYYETLTDKTDSEKYLNAAKYFYYQASRTDISNANALVGHARVALHQNKTRDAKNTLMMALNFNPDNPRVTFYLGETFFQEGDYTEAIDYYKWAYTHGYQNDFKTNYKLGICYEKLNDEHNARTHYNNALRIKPDNEDVKKRLKELTPTGAQK